MRRDRILGFIAVSVTAIVVGHGIAAAQGQATQPSSQPDAMAGLARQVALSPAEQLSQSESMLSKMESSRNSVRRQLETARAQRDVVKTLCLNDKLNQIDVAIRSAQERRQALEAAVKRNDADLASHEFTILSVLRQRVEQLSIEANLCIGKEADIVGESSVTTTIDPGLPQEDPSEFPPDSVVTAIPGCSSCTG